VADFLLNFVIAHGGKIQSGEAVCLDAGNDPLKANTVQIFKSKGVTSIKTV
jgi:hypothetical protein